MFVRRSIHTPYTAREGFLACVGGALAGTISSGERLAMRAGKGPYLFRYGVQVRVAKRTPDARKRARLSQAGLAARARTSQPAVPRYDARTGTPSLATLERLLAASGSSLVLNANAGPSRVSGRRIRDRMALLQRFRGQLQEAARRHGVRNIRVFGSVARGDETANSDIDLLVELEP